MVREPDLRRARGHAWRVPIIEEAQQRGCLRAWVLHCPGVHPFWNNWLLHLCHLRPLAIPGAPPAVLHYRDAAYELVSSAIDPEQLLEPEHLSGEKHPPTMQPIDWAIQFHGIGDVAAVEMVDRLVGMACSGVLPPDTDYRERWRGCIWASIEHKTTGHPMGQA